MNRGFFEAIFIRALRKDEGKNAGLCENQHTKNSQHADAPRDDLLEQARFVFAGGNGGDSQGLR